MARRRGGRKRDKAVESLRHEDASRSNIPSAEYQDALDEEVLNPIQVPYERRNRDLDPQLVWRGKDVINSADLVVPAPPLFIQERVHPQVLVNDLIRRSAAAKSASGEPSGSEGDQFDLFADFNGIAEDARSTEFYEHEANWTNRMILGDSLHVMASLAEREGLRGKVQSIYLDPPYGIKFNSNFQWSTTSHDVKDSNAEHITREPEQVKAFRDTWRDGVHSYLTYLRDRLTVARELLHESGSIFMQIGDENVHRVRAVMDEVFGEDNYQNLIYFQTTGGLATSGLTRLGDYALWYAKNNSQMKMRRVYVSKKGVKDEGSAYKSIETDISVRRRLTSSELSDPENTLPNGRVFRISDLCGQGAAKRPTPFMHQGREYNPTKSSHWKPNYPDGVRRTAMADRIYATPKTLNYVRFFDDYPVSPLNNVWLDTGHSGFAYDKIYVVQTSVNIVQRCLLMTTDPGDLVLDPTCGSGTAAYVAEQWGRRWITIDTSRVALALARARIMGARYPWYLLADSPEGRQKEAEVTRSVPSDAPTRGDIRQGFVYERVPHITLKAIANNAEIDVIWERMQPAVETAIGALNAALRGHSEPFKVETGGRAGQEIDFTETAPPPENSIGEASSGQLASVGALLEWEMPREAPDGWPEAAKAALEDFWQARIARQQEIDASIAARADYEYLYDKPYPDENKVRVAGPFTVESLSPHREVHLDESDRPVLGNSGESEHADFADLILKHLGSAGVQQAHKEDRIEFSSLAPWPGRLICAEGRYHEGASEALSQNRAGIFIGPEFGGVMRSDLVAAAEEAADAGFDVLISCAFAYGPHVADISELGSLPILKARMNADLHMSKELADTGKGNLFVIFGEPDIEIIDVDGEEEKGGIQVQINGVDVFRPQTGKVVRDNRDGIACWMIDIDYNGESFFVRHAYFLGQNKNNKKSDPYKSLKTSLKAEINQEAWATLNSAVSRPFPKPESGRIAVKVINHLGDEVMKVYRVD